MRGFCAVLCAGALLTPAVMAAEVVVSDSTAPWQGFIHVYELPENGGGYVFGSPWGVADLVATFDDANARLTMSPNTIGDPNEFWYQGGRPGEDPDDPNDNGGPGAPGNKIIEANLYQEVTGAFNGETVTFSGTMTRNWLSSTHQTRIFIRDFAANFSSSVDVFIPPEVGEFSISLDTIDDPTRRIQWGIQVTGVNVWWTDVATFGEVEFATEPIPSPASIALLGLGGVMATRRRR